MSSPFDARPIVVAVAGPNGAGKTTFCGAHLFQSALRVVNADELAKDLHLGPYDAAELAKRIREALLEQGESFIFETVFFDPVGEKLDFLRRAGAKGNTVVLCFVGLESARLCDERVAMRVLQRRIHEWGAGGMESADPRVASLAAHPRARITLKFQPPQGNKKTGAPEGAPVRKGQPCRRGQALPARAFCSSGPSWKRSPTRP